MIVLAIIALVGGGTLMCSAYPTDLTDAEIAQYFGTTRDAAPAYAIAEIVMPGSRTKRSQSDTWKISVNVDGKVKKLSLKPTAGILANQDTQVWTSKGTALGSDDVTYTRNDNAMTELGDFTFYQDYGNKAAVTLFHKDNTIEGGVGYMTIKQDITDGEQTNKEARRYLLVTEKDLNISKTGGFINDWGDLHFEGPRRNGPATVVYPQIMIDVDMNYTADTTAGTLRKVLGEMNRVDMLYRGVKEPKIYLNIPAIIIPENEFTTPWAVKGDPDNLGVIYYQDGVNFLGQHFEPYKEEFPDDSWDLLMSFVSKPLGEKGSDQGTIGGFTFSDISCGTLWRKYRVSLMAIDAGSFVAVAHEIAHFFNADHDETVGCTESPGIMAIFDQKEAHNLLWTTCTLTTLKDFFSKEKSTCMDNIPETLIVPDDVVSISADDACAEYGLGASSGEVQCNEFLSCSGGESEEIAPPKGTICSKDGEANRVCYNGQCLLHKK